MTEQSKTYFHIQWSGLDREAWQKGDQITTQKSKYNPFYSGLIRDLEHIEFDEDKKVGLIEYSNSIFGKDVNRNIKSKKKISKIFTMSFGIIVFSMNLLQINYTGHCFNI